MLYPNLLPLALRTNPLCNQKNHANNASSLSLSIVIESFLKLTSSSELLTRATESPTWLMTKSPRYPRVKPTCLLKMFWPLQSGDDLNPVLLVQASCLLTWAGVDGGLTGSLIPSLFFSTIWTLHAQSYCGKNE